MSIGLITISHNRIGEEILGAACQIVGAPPLPCRNFDVLPDIDTATLRQTLRELVEDMDSGDGVLILTDLYASTPANLARDATIGCRVSIVSGLNLPMILRAFNYAHLDLAGITQRAAAGGQRGIISAYDDGR